MYRGLAAPASFSNVSTALSSPPTPGFMLKGKVNYPRQPSFNASSMLLLTCQMLYDYSQKPWDVSAYNTEQADSDICIAITNIFDPTHRHALFQNRHAMWALWLAAMQQATQYNLRPGVFGLQVQARAQWTDVAIMTYTRDPEPYDLVAAPDDQTVDLASRSNEPRASSDTLLPPGTSSTNHTLVSSLANSNSPYRVVIGQAGSSNLDMVKVFNTICEAMVQRASSARREPLTNRWNYYCKATGYKISLQRPYALSDSPSYAAVMGGMANLLKAMIEARRDTETTFDVLLENGEVALLGVLIDGRADEAGSGLSLAKRAFGEDQ